MKQSNVLTVNKIITPRKKKSKGGDVDYSYFETAKRTLKGNTIERNIQWYRMWFTYLKLCYELEDRGEKIKGKKIKVSKFYDEWQLGKSLLNVSFDDWWEQKKHLFELQKIQTGSTNSDDYIVVSVPVNRTKQDLVRDFNEYLNSSNQKFTNKALYPFSKNIIPFIRLHIQYNCLVMHYNDIRIKEMMRWCNDKYGGITGVIQNKQMDEKVVFGITSFLFSLLSSNKSKPIYLKSSP